MSQELQDRSDIILVSHGQPSAPEPAEVLLRDLADSVQPHIPDRKVLSATLATTGRLEQVCREAGKTPLVYPCFMANGWFTANVLPRRLSGFNTVQMPPLGAEAALPKLVSDVLNTEAELRGWSLSEVELLLAAHGSARGPKAANATYEFSEKLESVCKLRMIRTAFVEQSPFIAHAANDSGSPGFCLPFFAMEGDHVRSDIQNALLGAAYSGVLLPVITNLPGVPELIATSINHW